MQKILMVLALIVLCACSLQPASSTETVIIPAPERSSLCEQKGYTWNSDSTCTFEEENEEYRIEIAYPIELLPSPLIETALDNYIADYRANFMQQVADGNPTPPAAPWFFEMKYTVYHHSPTVLSVQFSELWFLGGAHHNATLKSFSFDLEANQLLAFEDLFEEGVDVLAVIQPLARAALVETMNARGIMIDETNLTLLMDTDELNDFRNFALTESHLLLSLGSYPLAPHLSDQGNVQIPLSALAGSLRNL
jgi:hypothetical protein